MLCCLLHRPRYHLRNQCVSGHVDRSEAWENAVQGLGKRQRNPRYLAMPDLHLTDRRFGAKIESATRRYVYFTCLWRLILQF